MPDSYRLKPHDGLPWRKREPPGTDPVRYKRRAGSLANTLSGEEVKPPPRAANFTPSRTRTRSAAETGPRLPRRHLHLPRAMSRGHPRVSLLHGMGGWMERSGE